MLGVSAKVAPSGEGAVSKDRLCLAGLLGLEPGCSLFEWESITRERGRRACRPLASEQNWFLDGRASAGRSPEGAAPAPGWLAHPTSGQRPLVRRLVVDVMKDVAVNGGPCLPGWTATPPISTVVNIQNLMWDCGILETQGR